MPKTSSVAKTTTKDAQGAALGGLVEAIVSGKSAIVEHEPDSDLHLLKAINASVLAIEKENEKLLREIIDGGRV